MISVDKQVDILFWHQQGKSQRWIAAKVQVGRGSVAVVIHRGKAVNRLKKHCVVELPA